MFQLVLRSRLNDVIESIHRGSNAGWIKNSIARRQNRLACCKVNLKVVVAIIKIGFSEEKGVHDHPILMVILADDLKGLSDTL